ncbi:hypothetical protein GUJ93_ZPchr0013g37433 [Zizania palustris]|uniref:TLDc domain-containing protein n=1 Tax=Zizania palustris TaxID=103762 RepID=A0A8J6BZG3_ZIZPA|nr:hypothetical protein GUJ93_ZPchr0013g37433 [Zizania palustris]
MVDRGGKRIQNELLEILAGGKVPGGHELTKIPIFVKLNQLQVRPHRSQPGEGGRGGRREGKGEGTHPEGRLHGTSGSCETFGNSCLAHSPDFELKNVELWGFTHSRGRST